jgi:ATP-binding protein involved in chromosome partitioning
LSDKKNNPFSPIPLKAKNIIAIASGKGGVGKTTVTVNLALALAEKKKKVGLLDADIYGPNVPLMLGLQNEAATVKDTKLIPVKKFNLKIMSVGFVADPDKALIWRGPLANKVIEQFLSDVEWGELDVLLIDLPPGTGDVPLSIVQKTELTGGIIVTTPQEASIADVKKMINMYQTTNTRIFGIVENMKFLVCPDCSSRIDLYPNEDNRGISKVLGHELLAEFPFEPRIGVKTADGSPFYISNNNSSASREYQKLADKILKILK